MLSNLVDKWHSNVNDDLFTGVIFLDFAKAFDTIDHKLLIKKLSLYGLSDSCTKFLTSYLNDRKQAVFQGSSLSPLSPIKYGVPQGSILGPLLFSIYINDLPLHISSSSELFADDTTVHNAYKNLETVYTTLQNDISKLTSWTEMNHMAIHPQKSKFMLVTNRQKRQNIKSNPHKLYILDKQLEEVDAYKLLGLTVDNNLTWTKHLSLLCKRISVKTFQLNRIKNFLDQHTRTLFFHAYIKSDIDYVSTCWDMASQNSLKPLNSIYRRALKLILLKSSSLLPNDYKKLDILPLPLKCKYNKAVFMYKIMNKLTPVYLYEMFPSNVIRGKKIIRIPKPRTNLFMTSLTYSGTKLWNAIPPCLKMKPSLLSFRKAYHIYLINQV